MIIAVKISYKQDTDYQFFKLISFNQNHNHKQSIKYLHVSNKNLYFLIFPLHSSKAA